MNVQHPEPNISISIGILETGVPPVDLAARYGRYDAMVRDMLGDRYRFRSYDVQSGNLPARPDDHAAYLITGSSAGVYDPLPWIAPLERFIRMAHGRAAMIGICFGHQIMAQALGGEVEKSSKGWGLGLHAYDVTETAPWMDPDVKRIAVAASHQDQVVRIPDGATILAASAFTPHAALAYRGGRSLSVQFHPEFERGFAAELVERRRSQLTGPFADQAIASLDAPSDAPKVAGWFRRFIENR